MPVYVDMDDVIADTTRTLVEVLDSEFGRKADYEAIASFDLKVSFGLSDHEYGRFFRRVHEPDVILSFPPVPGAVETLAAWRCMGFPIAVVTGRLTVARQSSLDWLERHRVPVDSFTMVDKYARQDMDSALCLSLEAFSRQRFCLAVEDSPFMADFLAGTMRVPVALMDRPWNRTARVPGPCRRHRAWDSVRECLAPGISR
jgi:beta-phosphoglucomutase-like phosphatase (HAD superfamily)